MSNKVSKEATRLMNEYAIRVTEIEGQKGYSLMRLQGMSPLGVPIYYELLRTTSDVVISKYLRAK